jgi:hypothetical protein
VGFQHQTLSYLLLEEAAASEIGESGAWPNHRGQVRSPDGHLQPRPHATRVEARAQHQVIAHQGVTEVDDPSCRGELWRLRPTSSTAPVASAATTLDRATVEA